MNVMNSKIVRIEEHALDICDLTRVDKCIRLRAEIAASSDYYFPGKSLLNRGSLNSSSAEMIISGGGRERVEMQLLRSFHPSEARQI